MKKKEKNLRNMKNLRSSIAFLLPIVLLLSYSVMITYKYLDAMERLSSVESFFNDNPEKSIQYKPLKHINANFLESDSLRFIKVTIILDMEGCPSCIRHVANTLNDNWDKISDFSKVFVVGNEFAIDLDMSGFRYSSISRDSVYANPSFASNPMYVIHDGKNINHLRLVSPTKYGYDNFDSEYISFLSEVVGR